MILWFAAVKKKDYVPVYKIDQSTCVTTPGETTNDPPITTCDEILDRIKEVIPMWRIVAFMSMLIFHSVGYGVQLIMWPFTYEKVVGERYTNIWLAYKKAWQYTAFITCTGTVWITLALSVSGWQDTATLN